MDAFLVSVRVMENDNDKRGVKRKRAKKRESGDIHRLNWDPVPTGVFLGLVREEKILRKGFHWKKIEMWASVAAKLAENTSPPFVVSAIQAQSKWTVRWSFLFFRLL